MGRSTGERDSRMMTVESSTLVRCRDRLNLRRHTGGRMTADAVLGDAGGGITSSVDTKVRTSG
jgi:hypothetical protein